MNTKQLRSGAKVEREVRPDTIGILKDLVGFATESSRSNLALIDYIESYLKGLGIKSQLFYNDERNKANLYATVGPTDKSGIALSGHTDVVPVAGQNWSFDPWTLTGRDDRLFGRGSCDMKGFIATALASLPDILKQTLQRPLHLCFSYDEEIGCKGVRSLLAHLQDQPNKPAGCIVGEPTGMRVVVGHKGKLTMGCDVTGHACHSALLTSGVNAIEGAAQIVEYLRKTAGHLQQNGPFDTDFDIPFTTVHTGVIKGGLAINIIPDKCNFIFEFRHLPTDDPQTLLRQLQGFVDKDVKPRMRSSEGRQGSFSWSEVASFPGLDTSKENPLVQMALACAEQHITSKVSFGTEAGLFQRAGIPSVVCGPGHIEQAHKPDEFVETSQLANCEMFIERLGRKLATDDF